jgi:hypothetical protein
MPEKNLTAEEVKALYAIMPAPGECPHGTPKAMSGVFGEINPCAMCFATAKEKMAKGEVAASQNERL